MSINGFMARTRRGAPAVLAGAAVLAALSACDLPFNLGQPTTRAIESGAADTLTSSSGFQIDGTYKEAGQSWFIVMDIVRPDREDVVVTNQTPGSPSKVEAIIVGNNAYFSGQAFLAQHMGSDPLSQSLVKAAGNAWWQGSARLAPQLPNLTNGHSFQSTFLGSAVTQRTDHVTMEGVDAIELSGPRADVWMRAAPPYYLLHLRMKKGVVIDGLSEADLRFSNFNRNFEFAVPTNVIDFSNLSTLPPVYTVVSVDTSGCGSPCAVTAVLKNLGGMTGAQAPSTITFTMTANASRLVLGSCQVQVTPDVGYNATTTVGCTIANLTGAPANAATVTATADNPGRG
jgi:hypothetical protein